MTTAIDERQADYPVVSIVAPVYNEEAILEELYRRVSAVMETSGETWELVLVNDGSVDRSSEIMRALHARDPRVKVVDFARNFGHQVAITAGADYARAAAVVIIDADLQDPPEVILDLVAKWREGYEVVYAIRAERKGETWFKEITAKLFYRLIYRITDIDIPMGRLVVIVLKWMVASIPAILLMYLIIFIVMAIVMGLFAVVGSIF